MGNLGHEFHNFWQGILGGLVMLIKDGDSDTCMSIKQIIQYTFITLN